LHREVQNLSRDSDTIGAGKFVAPFAATAKVTQNPPVAGASRYTLI